MLRIPSLGTSTVNDKTAIRLHYASTNREFAMKSNWFAVGAIAAAIGVTLGAFGATEDLLSVFEIGVRYQMYHALGLLAVAWAAGRWPGSLPNASGWLFTLGILLFSGSLYLMTFTGARWLGAITPVGGLCFIFGWIALAMTALRGS
jgi:uncharacterized membrane protein YgdD (TMEM256/DUF423 family)